MFIAVFTSPYEDFEKSFETRDRKYAEYQAELIAERTNSRLIFFGTEEERIILERKDLQDNIAYLTELVNKLCETGNELIRTDLTAPQANGIISAWKKLLKEVDSINSRR